MKELEPPRNASALYKTLHATAWEFIHAGDQVDNSEERQNTSRARNIRSTNGFEHTFGHNTLVSTAPSYIKTMNANGFIEHMGRMNPYMQSWDTTITDIIIDETMKRAVVRASYSILVEEAEEAVENDIVWILTMEDDGKKVKKSVEFVDGEATQRITELMRKVM